LTDEPEKPNRKALDDAFIEYRKSIVVLNDRIFIAADIKKRKLGQFWGESIGSYITDKDTATLSKRLTTIREAIIEIAMQD